MNKTITLLIIGVIFLALLLMVLNAFLVEERHGVPVPVAENTPPQELVSPARIVPEERSVPAPALAPPVPDTPGSAALAPSIPPPAPEPEESAVQASSAESTAVKTVPAQIDAGQTRSQTAAPSSPASPKLPAMPEPGSRQTKGGANTITSIVVYATQEGATLRLGGDKPFVCKDMLLRDPDRLVLDFEGHWNVTIPGIPQNKLIKAIRVGRQTDSTRMVVDLHRAPASYRLITTSPQGLDVRLR